VTELRKAGELVADLGRIEFECQRQGRGKLMYFTAQLELVLELEWEILWASWWWKQTELSKVPVLY